jgi:hypothetical protein
MDTSCKQCQGGNYSQFANAIAKYISCRLSLWVSDNAPDDPPQKNASHQDQFPAEILTGKDDPL